MSNLYRVQYGYFKNGGMTSEEKFADVLATDDKEATLKAVFASNGYTRPGMTLQVLSVRNVGPCGGATGGILS